MPTIYIDEQAYEVPEGDNVLEACLSAGIDLPYFCWHPEMGSVGACRQCALVQYRDEEDTRGRIVMGCMTPVADGARFSMQGGAAGEFRENIIESLMLNHPHDCPVCAEGGECHLQDMTVMVGHRNRRYRGKKNTHRNQNLGPLINHEMNRCISCYRCTRFYNDYAGGTDLAAQGAHDHVYFGRQQDGTLESEFAGNLVEVCPTGVFTDKPLVNDYTRKWDLQSAPSICNGCALGCNTMPGERYGKLKRIHNRFNREVNGYFLCDRGRYGSSYVNDESRSQFAGLRRPEGNYDAIESTEALKKMHDWCGGDNRIAAVGSPRASLESNYLLRHLVGEANYCHGMDDHESGLVNEIARQLSEASIISPSMHQAESADAILVLGEDVTNTAPRLALSLRQSVRNLAKQMATDMRIPLWQDEAVRVLAQDKLSPLFILAVADTPLDDVAELKLNLRPSDIALFGFAIAAKLDSNLPAVKGFDDAENRQIEGIAESLKNAQRPLLVSGTGCRDKAVIQAAAAIAKALDNKNAMLSYCLPEANSLGMALMQSGRESSLKNLCLRASKGEIQTLIVIENDLYRRAPKSEIDELLSNIPNLVVIDCIDTPTLTRSSLALPAASFAESEGTLVSSEGRAQRHYPVYQPAEQRQPSWQWLNQLAHAINVEGVEKFQHFDDLTEACASEFSALANITQASPPDEFRSHGLKLPRQPHRYSGRTAMRANISVHEPKQPEDTETPFSFSMEGSSDDQPGSLIPFVWSPGWNSNQSVHKYQIEVGGALKGGTPGVRLIEPASASTSSETPDFEIPARLDVDQQSLEVVPLYKIFGSEELSAHSEAIAELITPECIQLNSSEATRFGLKHGEPVKALLAGREVALSLQINDSIPAGCAGYTVGLPDSEWLAPASKLALNKSEVADV